MQIGLQTQDDADAAQAAAATKAAAAVAVAVAAGAAAIPEGAQAAISGGAQGEQGRPCSAVLQAEGDTVGVSEGALGEAAALRAAQPMEVDSGEAAAAEVHNEQALVTL